MNKTKQNIKNKTKTVTDKYIGNQLTEKTKTCNYDYLVINYKGKPQIENQKEGFTFASQDYGTKQFKEVVSIDLNETRFASMVYDPRNPKIDQDLCQIKIENHLFYTWSLSEIKNQLEKLIAIFGIKLYSVSRVDVCCDFENVTSEFNQLIQNIIAGDVLIGGRAKKVSLYNELLNVYATTNKGLITHDGISFGKKSAPRYLRIYNKSKEMDQVKYKHHIADFWKLSSFKDLSNVWRFEYSLNSTYLKNHKVSYNDLWNCKFIVTLLKTAYTNHFELKTSTGKSQVNKEKTIPFIDFDQIYNITVEVLAKVKKELIEGVQRSLNSVKRQIKGLYRSYFSTESNYFYNALGVHLTNYDLWDWFYEKKDSYINDYRKEFIKKGMLCEF